MPPAIRSHQLVPVAAESSPNSEDDSNSTSAPEGKTLTAEEREQNAIAMQLIDLGSGRRDRVTRDDNAPAKRVNQKALLANRTCNQQGSDAAKQAARNQPQLGAWNNFHRSDENEVDGEKLTDIAGGQTHREQLKNNLAEQGIRDLEDTYDEPRGKRGRPKHTSKVAKSTTGLSSHGNFANVRFGGSSSHEARKDTITSSSTKLDPALDPDRVNSYKGGKNSSARRGKDKNVNQTIGSDNAKPSHTATPKTTLGALRVPKNDAKSNVSNSSVVVTQQRHLDIPKLADPADFMAFVSQCMTQPTPHPAPSAPVASPSSDGNIRKITVEELKAAASISPSAKTDGVPSPGAASIISVQDDTSVDPATQLVGLGITNEEATIEKLKDVPVLPDINVSAAENLLDSDVCNHDTPTLLPSPKETVPAGMTCITQEDAEMWNILKPMLQTRDIAGLVVFMNDRFPDNDQTSSELASSTTSVGWHTADTSKFEALLGDPNKFQNGEIFSPKLALFEASWAKTSNSSGEKQAVEAEPVPEKQSAITKVESRSASANGDDSSKLERITDQARLNSARTSTSTAASPIETNVPNSTSRGLGERMLTMEERMVAAMNSTPGVKPSLWGPGACASEIQEVRGTIATKDREELPAQPHHPAAASVLTSQSSNRNIKQTSSILGDSKVVQRNAVRSTPALSNSISARNFSQRSKPSSAKYVHAGPGFRQLLKDHPELENIKLASSTAVIEPATPPSSTPTVITSPLWGDKKVNDVSSIDRNPSKQRNANDSEEDL